MLTFGGHRIFLVVEPTDMRKSFNGLAGIASELLGASPASRDLFVFANRGRNRLKILLYDESGTWVLAKRLDRGTFAWPDGDAADTVEYRAEELALLLGGLDAGALVSRKWHRREQLTSISRVRA
jgi:transposase